MSEVLSDREAVIFYAEQRGYASAMEAERKLHESRIKAQAAEIERLRGDLKKAEWLLVDASVQLAEGRIKTRRNRALLIRQFLAALTGDNT